MELTGAGPKEKGLYTGKVVEADDAMQERACSERLGTDVRWCAFTLDALACHCLLLLHAQLVLGMAAVTASKTYSKNVTFTRHLSLVSLPQACVSQHPGGGI